MNTEQLEDSLRSEIDGYVQTMREQMSQEIDQLQSTIEEISRHNSILSEKVNQLKSNVTPDANDMSPQFAGVLTEHLRIAREQGVKIVTDAMSSVPEEPSKDLTVMRDAVSEISTQTSQAEILKSLLNYVSTFAPRGTFFVIKSENLVGWRSFGENHDEETVRDLQLPVSTDTILGAAVNSSLTQRNIYGSHTADKEFLEHLGYGKPHQMMALPLVVRGRAVAVLYVDGGEEDKTVKLDALETLMRVAGLTVELLASARSAARQTIPAETQQMSAAVGSANTAYSSYNEQADTKTASQADSQYDLQPDVQADSLYDSESESKYDSQYETAQTSFSNSTPTADYTSAADSPMHYNSTENSYAEMMPSFENTAPRVSDNYPPPLAFEASLVESASQTETFSFDKSGESFEKTPTESYTYEPKTDFGSYQYQPEPTETIETKGFESFSFSNSDAVITEMPVTDFSSSSFESKFTPSTETSFEPTTSRFAAPTAMMEVEAPAPAEPLFKETSAVESKSVTRRFGERNIELPIEVPEEEKRSHNDARRFARLLVSEIKLYNEQRVKEGRQSSDIYERLSEAIDRSREMYDKRVNPSVSTKFDYFHYELINTLAEGDDAKMGAAYPGAAV